MQGLFSLHCYWLFHTPSRQLHRMRRELLSLTRHGAG